MSRRSRSKYLLERPTFFTRVSMTIFGQKLPYIGSGGEGTHSLYIFGKETDDGFEHSTYSPGGVPLFGVILRDGEAYFGIGLEPSVFVHEDDIRRLEGVLVGEQYLSVVQSLMEIGALWTLKGEMPGVDVVLQGTSSKVRQFFLLQLLSFRHYSLLADIGRLHMCENNIDLRWLIIKEKLVIVIIYMKRFLFFLQAQTYLFALFGRLSEDGLKLVFFTLLRYRYRRILYVHLVFSVYPLVYSCLDC